MISKGKKLWSAPRLRLLNWWESDWFRKWLDLARQFSIAK